jgi:hypothetical protein
MNHRFWPSGRPSRTWAFLLLTVGAFSVSLVENLPGFSQTHYTMTAFVHCTHDDALLQALSLMQEGPAEPSLNLIIDHTVRIVFKDMKSINKGLKNYDALSWLSNQGDQVIFINEKHRNAPPEALAAMLAHEAMHNDAYNSINEEVAGWQREAQVWSAFRSRNSRLRNIEPGENALVDRENRIETEARHGTLANFVRNNPGYRGLAESSPGFGANVSTSTQPSSF